MVPEPSQQALAPIPRRIWYIAAVTGAGAFMAMLDSTLANLAVEAIRVDFDSSLPVIQWVATAYLIALAVSLPASGWLGARYGYGRVWMGALVAFTLTSALCAVAVGPATLIAARFAQGLAAGLMMPAGQAVIGAAAGPKQLGRLMGALGVVVSLGPALGPALGGLLLEVANWRWLFGINIPVGVLALIAARGLVPEGDRNRERPLDRRGYLLIGLGLPLLLYGATEIGATGASFWPVSAVLLGAMLFAGFLFTALRAESPLIDLRLLRIRRFAAATATTGLTGANMYGGLLLIALYLQLVAGRDSVETGLLLLAMGLGSAAALYVGGRLTDRHGAGPVCIAGAGLLLLSTMPLLAPAEFSTATLTLLLVVRGIGMAWAQMPAMTAAYASVTNEQIGDAATLVNITQRIGGALGAIGVVLILANSPGEADYTGAFAFLASLSLATVVTGLLLHHTRQVHD